MTSPAPSEQAAHGALKLPPAVITRFPTRPPSVATIALIGALAIGPPGLLIAASNRWGLNPTIYYVVAATLGGCCVWLFAWRLFTEWRCYQARTRLRQRPGTANPEEFCRLVLFAERAWPGPSMNLTSTRMDQAEHDLGCRLPLVWIDGDQTMVGVRDPASLPKPPRNLSVVPRPVGRTPEGAPAHRVFRRDTILTRAGRAFGWTLMCAIVIVLAFIAAALISTYLPNLPILPIGAIALALTVPLVALSIVLVEKLRSNRTILVVTRQSVAISRVARGSILAEQSLDPGRLRLFVTHRGIRPNALGHLPGHVATHLIGPDTGGELVVYDLDFRDTPWRRVFFSGTRA